MRRPLYAILGAFTGVGLACSSFDGSPPPTDTSDAGPDAALPVPEASTDDAGASCPTIYVSAGGSDQNTGCDQTKPKATIASAVGYVKTLNLVREEIHVCAGTYVENGFVLDYPVTLRGGYECALWQRAADFGWQGFEPTTGAGKFGTTNATIIDPGTAQNALTISGATLDRTTTLEGFTLRGNPTAGGTTLLVVNGAATFISNNQILGATGGPFSIGLHFKDTASSEVSHNVIRGGAGGAAAVMGAGSAGIFLESTGIAPTIHDNEIQSGAGKSANVATVGVQVSGPTQLTNNQALRNNSIIFQGSSDPNTASSYGVWVLPRAKADIIDNGIYGNAFAAGPSVYGAYGVYVSGDGSTIVGNRFLGGTTTGAAPKPSLYPIWVNAAANIGITNNLIGFEATLTTNAVGIAAPTGSNIVRIDHNTIIVPANAVADGIAAFGTNVSVDANLVVGARNGLLGVSAFCTDTINGACNAPLSLNDNAFVNTQAETFVQAGAAKPSDPCGPGTAAANGPAFEAAYPTAKPTGTVTLLGSASPGCKPGDTLCRKCASADCVFDVFDASSYTVSALVSGKLPLAANVSCLVAQGGGTDVMTVATDVVGTMRTSPASIGATEDDNACSMAH